MMPVTFRWSCITRCRFRACALALPCWWRPGVAFVWPLAGEGPTMYHFRLSIVVVAVLTGAGLAATPATLAAGVAGPGAVAAGGSGLAPRRPFPHHTASSPAHGNG